MTDILAQLCTIISIYVTFSLIHYQHQITYTEPDEDEEDDEEKILDDDRAEKLAPTEVEKLTNTWVAVSGLALLWGMVIGFVLGITLALING